jgi:cytoskeletal protein CcmA (bactofilin family)
MPPVEHDADGEPTPEANKLLVGEGVVIKGEVLVPDTLVVHGIVEGDDISVRHLIVGKSGLVKGNITVAENADIYGEIQGKFSVRQILILRGSSSVDANVSYGLLQIEQGASVKGGIVSKEFKTENKSLKVDELAERTRKSLQLEAPAFTRSSAASQPPATSPPKP